MKYKIGSYVLTHVNKNNELVISSELINAISIQNDIEFNLCIDIHNVQDNPNLVDQLKSLTINSLFHRVYLIKDRFSVAGVRNSILEIVRISDYDYVSFIDGDDSITPNYSEVLTYASTFEEDLIKFSGYWITRKGEKYSLTGENLQNSLKYVNWLYLYKVSFLKSSRITYPEISNNFAEDELFFTRMMLCINCRPIPCIEEEVYIYKHNNTGINSLDHKDSDIITQYLNYEVTFRTYIVNSNNSNNKS